MLCGSNLTLWKDGYICSWFMFSNQTLKPQEEGVTFACWPDRCWSSQAGAWSTQVQDNYPISYSYLDCQWFSMIGSLSPFTDVFTLAPPLPDVSSTSLLSNTPGCTSCWTLGRDLLHTFKDSFSLVHIIVTVMIIIMSSMSPNHQNTLWTFKTSKAWLVILIYFRSFITFPWSQCE